MAGLVHPDMEFRNVVYNPATLQMRIIDIGPTPGPDDKPGEVWRWLHGEFAYFFGYKSAIIGFWWGLCNVLRVLLAYPLDPSLVLHFCVALVKKWFTEKRKRKS